MKNKACNIPNDKEEQNMNATVQEYKHLDLLKLRTRSSKIISTESSLQDITPIDWSKDVLSGEKKVHIAKADKNN